MIIGAIVVLSFLSFKVWEIIPANEVAVIQTLSGNLKPITTAGPAMQWFGEVTTFPKLDIYEFEAPIVFNDAGSAILRGSIQWEIPVDDSNLIEVKTKYSNAQSIREGLVNKVVDKCVYMTGPLMSSAESYATKKTDLIRFIEDQILNGVYKTFTKEDKVEDPITGQMKTAKITEIVMDKNGLPARQEDPVLGSLGIRTSNLAISEIIYSEKVQEQIAEQQKITMAVQTAMADARKAEQNYITITKNGEASAAEAKWEQEVEKARAVTKAQQGLEAEKLEVAKAEQYKKRRILEADADAEYKRRIIVADGALTQKLTTYENVMGKFAEAVSKQKWVPDIQFGTDGKASGNTSAALIDMLSAKVAKDLALDMKIKE